MVISIGFSAMTYCVELDRKSSNLIRREKCKKIVEFINSKLIQTHKFGRAFEVVKAEYAIATTAWHQSQVNHRAACKLPKSPRGLTQKARGTRKTRRKPVGSKVQNIVAVGKSFEVMIEECKFAAGSKSDD